MDVCCLKKVKDSMQSLYWNPRSSNYVDSVLDGRQSTTVTEVANGMALRYGIATTGQTAEIVRQIIDPHQHPTPRPRHCSLIMSWKG